MQLPHEHTGVRTQQLLADYADRLRDSGGVLLLRHSAREFEPGRHDLLNPLTDAGRRLSTRLGAGLPEGLSLKGYASPVERCLETAQLMLAAYEGGATSRTRAMEGLGVFYVLDQMKMFMALREAGGLRPFVRRWCDGAVASDVVLPARVATQALVGGLADRLAARASEPAPANDGRGVLDVCVSHDLTVQMLRSVLFGVHADEDGEVEFLDGLLLTVDQGVVHIAAHDRPLAPLAPLLGSLLG